LRGALDVAGAVPGAEFVGVAGVFVADDGVEIVDLFHAGFDEAADGGGAFHAFAVVALGGVFRSVDGLAVVGEVGDEIGGEFVGDEAGGERGLGGFLGGAVAGLFLELQEEGVGGGEERDLAGGFWRAEIVGETGLVLRDGAGGAGDVLQVEPEGVEADFECRGPAALLLRFLDVEVFDDLGNVAEAFLALAACGEVCGVVGAGGLHTAKHVVAAGFAIVHKIEVWSGWVTGIAGGLPGDRVHPGSDCQGRNQAVFEEIARYIASTSAKACLRTVKGATDTPEGPIHTLPVAPDTHLWRRPHTRRRGAQSPSRSTHLHTLAMHAARRSAHAPACRSRWHRLAWHARGMAAHSPRRRCTHGSPRCTRARCAAHGTQ